MTAGDDGMFKVEFGSGATVNLDELRKRRSAFMPDGGHAWVISTVHALDDPERALDRMELGPATLVGITAIQCLLCHEEYRTLNRFHKCPQTING